MQTSVTSRTIKTKRFRLRLLQTTDMHMHILPFNYAAQAPSNHIGISNLIASIKAYQGDEIPTLLFDTGDFLQGSPLADFAAKSDHTRTHPIAQVFNTLNYSAIALGNHDFDYGLDTLSKVVNQINSPVLCGNITLDADTTPFAPTTLLNVPLSEQDTINIGVIGLTTPVISLLDQNGHDRLSAAPPVTVAEQAARQLRQDGADLILALCHFGLDPDDRIENVAADIAALAEVDCVMAGHTHETFPIGNQHTVPFIDQTAGTVHNKPLVMAGSHGQYLGVIELDLVVDQDMVQIEDASVDLVTPQIAEPVTPEQFAPIVSLHEKTLAHMSAAIAQTTLPFSTEFSLIAPDLTQYLLSCARQLHIEAILAGTPDADLPILTTAAPFRTGSRADPSDFISLPAGPITRSDVAAIYPFNNSPVALHRNGAQVKNWLEGAALLFHQITPGQTKQALIDPRVPPYRFDTIFGLTYVIDVSAPPGQRISDVCHNGKPVGDTDAFVLVTSTNRLSHGQNIPQNDIIHIAQQSSQDILVQSLQRQSPVTVPCPHVWDFKSISQTKAQFDSSPMADPRDVDRTLHDNGLTAQGFRQFTLDFDT